MIGVGCVRGRVTSLARARARIVRQLMPFKYPPNSHWYWWKWWSTKLSKRSTNHNTFYQNIYAISNTYMSKNLYTSLNYCCLKLEFTVWNKTCYIIPSTAKTFQWRSCSIKQKYSVMRINDLEGVLECLFHFGLYLNLTSGLFSNARSSHSDWLNHRGCYLYRLRDTQLFTVSQHFANFLFVITGATPTPHFNRYGRYWLNNFT